MAGRRRAQPSGQQGALPVEDYRHAGATRPNNPPAAIAAEGRTPPAPRTSYAYSPRLDPALRADPTGRADALPPLLEKATREKLTAEEAALLAEALRRHEPWLEWAGKRETPGFAVDPVALHIHERVSTQAILRAAARQDVTRDLFADPTLSYAQAVKFYQHDVDWANRLILGDSLQVMASLAQRENLAGKVQMIYLDPPYGIRFGSNFQTEVGEKGVGDKASDLTREPEMVKAYRDTWTLGLHSYLTYLRDRLHMCHKLLKQSGHIFVQISDENLHSVRQLMDEVFGRSNFIAQISVQKTGSATGDFLQANSDFLLWFSKDKISASSTFQKLYLLRQKGNRGSAAYNRVIEKSGLRRSVIDDDFDEDGDINPDLLLWQSYPLTSDGFRETTTVPFNFQGRQFHPGMNRHWGVRTEELARAGRADRLVADGDQVRMIKLWRDAPAASIGTNWADIGGASGKVYVVQTAAKIVERCMLMTTKPGDIVLDPTCGSGTTAYVAEQWGRRWITIDTSRVAVAVARQRLITSTFDFYKLREPAAGLEKGFVCKTVPNVTLKAIAQNEALDAILAKHDPVLEKYLGDLNGALAGVTAQTRALLLAKLVEKQRQQGKRAINEAERRRWDLPKPPDGFQHWTVPFDADPDHPSAFANAIAAYRAAWRAKQDDVDKAIADAAHGEALVDQPEKVPGITRVSGPFTVEAVQPAETSLDEAAHGSPIDGAPQALDDTFADDAANTATADPQNAEAYLDQMLRLLRQDGVRFLDNKEKHFTRLEPLGARSQAIHAEGRWMLKGETDDDPEGRATVAVAFGPQYGPVTAQQVEQLLSAASRRGYEELVIAGFTFDGAAQAIIDEDPNPRVRVHMAFIRPDVSSGMSGLLKDTPAAQLFTVFGKPRSKLEPAGKDEWRVVMEGVDIYDPLTATITPTRADKVAAWFVDSDYDGRSFCITQAFFPDKDAWSKLSAALKGVVDEEAFAALSGTVSLPFLKGDHACVAVKVIDPRGNEVMRLHRLEG